MISLHILNDVLDYDSRNEIVQYMYKNRDQINGVIQFTKDPYQNLIKDNSVVGIFCRIAEKYFNISSAVGYERWYNVDHRPNSWHFDKDEKVFNESGRLNLPLCTILYYPHVSESLKGGELRIRPDKDSDRDVILQPKTNRLIIFSQGALHMVEPFVGERCSMVINPWSYELQ